MQSRSQWDFFDMQIESANKGGGDEGFFFGGEKKKNLRRYCHDILSEKKNVQIPPLTASCQAEARAGSTAANVWAR